MFTVYNVCIGSLSEDDHQGTDAVGACKRPDSHGRGHLTSPARAGINLIRTSSYVCTANVDTASGNGDH